LNLDEQVQKYLALDVWFKAPQGFRAAKAFTEELALFDGQLRGDRLLQLGHCGDNIWLESLRYTQKWIVSPTAIQNNVSLTASINQLPLENASLDCIIAPFLFEAFSVDKVPLDELDRILKPMGHIIFWGINPLSLWGMALKFGLLPLMGHGPFKLTSSLAVQYAVLSRGFRQCILNTFYYIPPLSRSSLIHHCEFLNEMGKMLWLYPAGFYCLIVQKHEIINPSFVLDPVKDNYLVCADSPFV
jgi:hypothetical protein